jgi:predicted transcriptional regulator
MGLPPRQGANPPLPATTRPANAALAIRARQLGQAIAGRRRALGLTQARLAHDIGTGASAISRVERGHYRVSLFTLDRIAWALGAQVVVGITDLDAEIPSDLLSAVPHDPVASAGSMRSVPARP